MRLLVLKENYKENNWESDLWCMHWTVLHNFLRTEDSEATKKKHWVKKHEGKVLENLHNLPFRPLQSRSTMADLQVFWNENILNKQLNQHVSLKCKRCTTWTPIRLRFYVIRSFMDDTIIFSQGFAFQVMRIRFRAQLYISTSKNKW